MVDLSIATELRALEKRALELEDGVRGALACLRALDAAQFLDHFILTTDQQRRDYDSTINLLRLVERELERMYGHESERELSEEIGFLASRLEREGGDHG